MMSRAWPAVFKLAIILSRGKDLGMMEADEGSSRSLNSTVANVCHVACHMSDRAELYIAGGFTQVFGEWSRPSRLDRLIILWHLVT